MSVRTLATMVQMPALREVSSVISTPQSQEIRPRKPRSQAPPLKLAPLSAAETEAIGVSVSAEIMVIIARSFLNRVCIFDNFFNLYI